MSEGKDDDKKLDSLTDFLGWLWIVCLIIPIVLIVLVIVAEHMESVDTSGWGIYGDFVGGLSNPLISALTFLGLLFTIIQNQKVLRINEQELEETRKEIALTREANEKQAEEFRLQNEMIRRDSSAQALSQALSQLYEEIRSASAVLIKESQGEMTVAEYLEYPRKELIRGIDLGHDDFKEAYDKILNLVPLAVSYAKLLIKFNADAPHNPMLYSAASISYMLIEALNRNGYFANDFTDEELGQLHEILSEVM